MTPEQIKLYEEQYKGDDLDGVIALLKFIDSTREKLEGLCSAEVDRHIQEIKRLNEETANNKRRCPHPRAFCSYVPDPWSSYWECTLCGKQRVRPQD